MVYLPTFTIKKINHSCTVGKYTIPMDPSWGTGWWLARDLCIAPSGEASRRGFFSRCFFCLVKVGERRKQKPTTTTTTTTTTDQGGCNRYVWGFWKTIYVYLLHPICVSCSHCSFKVALKTLGKSSICWYHTNSMNTKYTLDNHNLCVITIFYLHISQILVLLIVFPIKNRTHREIPPHQSTGHTVQRLRDTSTVRWRKFSRWMYCRRSSCALERFGGFTSSPWKKCQCWVPPE